MIKIGWMNFMLKIIDLLFFRLPINAVWAIFKGSAPFCCPCPVARLAGHFLRFKSGHAAAKNIKATKARAMIVEFISIWCEIVIFKPETFHLVFAPIKMCLFKKVKCFARTEYCKNKQCHKKQGAKQKKVN